MGLSVWQLKRQLAFLASRAAWSETPQGLVYNGGAFVSEDLEGNFRMGSVNTDGPAVKTGTSNTAGDTPFCRVRCLRAEWDRRSNESRIERALFQLWSSAGGGNVPGTNSQAGFDSHGINQVTGVNRAATDGQGQSQGRDVDELISRFVETYGGHFVDSQHGFQGRFDSVDVMRKVSGASVLKRAAEVEVFNPLQANYYHAVLRLRSTGAPAGQVRLDWDLPLVRFDSYPLAAPQLVVRRGTNPGDAAPTSPTSGGTLLSGILASAGFLVDNTIPVSPGTYNYAVWIPYGETPAAQAGSPDRYSARVTVSGSAT